MVGKQAAQAGGSPPPPPQGCRGDASQRVIITSECVDEAAVATIEQKEKEAVALVLVLLCVLVTVSSSTSKLGAGPASQGGDPGRNSLLYVVLLRRHEV